MAVGVDREKRILRGFVLAQEGPFKSQGRGEFDRSALEKIIQLGNAKSGGLKSRFAHPGLSEDGIGKFLGRARDLYMDRAKDLRTGKMVSAVRGDLHFDPTASNTPSGDLAGYVMDLTESDPDALSSSLVLEVDEEFRQEKDGTLTKDKDGEPLPPLWRPKALHATDLVDEGDAVDGLLSVEGLSALPDGLVRQVSKMLDYQFRGCTREVVEARALSYLRKYLDWKFGDEKEAIGTLFGMPIVKTERTNSSVPDPVVLEDTRDLQKIKDRLELNRLTLKKYQK